MERRSTPASLGWERWHRYMVCDAQPDSQRPDDADEGTAGLEGEGGHHACRTRQPQEPEPPCPPCCVLSAQWCALSVRCQVSREEPEPACHHEARSWVWGASGEDKSTRTRASVIIMGLRQSTGTRELHGLAPHMHICICVRMHACGLEAKRGYSKAARRPSLSGGGGQGRARRRRGRRGTRSASRRWRRHTARGPVRRFLRSRGRIARTCRGGSRRRRR